VPGACSGEDALATAAEVLNRGGILVHPTSTLYGLGGRPNPDIDARIAGIKGRPGGSLIRLAATAHEARMAVPQRQWPPAAARLAGAFWPGPLTLIVCQVAIRVDPHPVPAALLGLVGGSMTSTSFNRTGDAPAATAEDVRSLMAAVQPARGPAGWLDGPPSPAGGPPSTLVRVDESGAVKILREGAVPAEAVREFAP